MFVRGITEHSIGRRARTKCQAGGLLRLCTSLCYSLLSNYFIDPLMKTVQAKLPFIYLYTRVHVLIGSFVCS